MSESHEFISREDIVSMIGMMPKVYKEYEVSTYDFGKQDMDQLEWKNLIENEIIIHEKMTSLTQKLHKYLHHINNILWGQKDSQEWHVL